MKTWTIYISVFVAGASVMMLELTGARLMAPYVGTSIIVWTSIIGLILGALSIGYTVGGRLADKYPRLQYFFLLLFISGFLVSLVYFFKDIVHESTFNMDPLTGSLYIVSVLYVIPSFVFGMVSPFAIRLQLTDVKQGGHIAGNLYALSTIGSIVGTFAAGFWLLPVFSSSQMLLFIAFTLMGLATVFSMLNHKTRKQSPLLLLIALVTVFSTSSYVVPLHASVIEVKESHYNTISIHRLPWNGQEATFLKTGPVWHSAKYDHHEELVFDYTKRYRLDQAFHQDIQSRLMLGGGGYTVVQDVLSNHPESTMGVVEIDEAMTEMAEKYFGLKEDDRIRIFHEDARTYMNRNEETYQSIYMDTFLDYSIPFQVATKEMMAHLHKSLDEEGVLLINVISGIEGENAWFLSSLHKTVSSVFDQVYVFKVKPGAINNQMQNTMLVAHKSDTPLSKEEIRERLPLEQQHYVSGFIDTFDYHPETLVLTDDFAPTDYFSFQLNNL